jgi:glycosyltransferase involved in cell wall biosynthesis
MVTPHLPPHQAANALLPHLLGTALTGRGLEVRFLTAGSESDRADAAFVRRRSARLRKTRVPQIIEATETWWKATPLIRETDVLHVHSSTWMNQVAARLAVRQGKPYVLTHYGTEIWHHDGRNARFRHFNRSAHHVTFYSQALLDRARELAVPTQRASVVYPPVADAFRLSSERERRDLRSQWVEDGQSLLLNVKRLHPLADQATLLEALALVLPTRPGTRLLIVGTGEEEGSLRDRAARLGLGESVRFLGLLPNEEVARLQVAADLFVLSSTLEATPTVVLEALACGTPVLTTDNPGGVELAQIFGGDIAVVPRADPQALAQAIVSSLANPRRAGERSTRILAERFRLASVANSYLALYREALQRDVP